MPFACRNKHRLHAKAQPRRAGRRPVTRLATGPFSTFKGSICSRRVIFMGSTCKDGWYLHRGQRSESKNVHNFPTKTNLVILTTPIDSSQCIGARNVQKAMKAALYQLSYGGAGNRIVMVYPAGCHQVGSNH